ncbi:hypothetical protein FB567DRAFT_554644 [Paraphoma chrysanthemicola]|uniref:Uncharacterized protein n=1 Tax=Paraphoma chrysanthemicola TaxID=798071 RepID=A0A8K0QUJ4_9PLEO|nr:hypothetical protein FB567DRAFT_554644 [Paraphoma chrysanthemicola]
MQIALPCFNLRPLVPPMINLHKYGAEIIVVRYMLAANATTIVPAADNPHVADLEPVGPSCDFVVVFIPLPIRVNRLRASVQEREAAQDYAQVLEFASLHGSHEISIKSSTQRSANLTCISTFVLTLDNLPRQDGRPHVFGIPRLPETTICSRASLVRASTKASRRLKTNCEIKHTTAPANPTFTIVIAFVIALDSFPMDRQHAIARNLTLSSPQTKRRGFLQSRTTALESIHREL